MENPVSHAAGAARKLAAEGLGTAFLAAAVIGAGIMAGGLTDNAALALMVTAATSALSLYVMLTVMIPVSGGHLNPAVTLAFTLRPSSPSYTGSLEDTQLLDILRTCRGRYGTTFDYVARTARALRDIGIRDAELERIMELAAQLCLGADGETQGGEPGRGA